MIKLNPNSQKSKILNLLRERNEEGVKVYELIAPKPDGLGCSQYNARIFGLRKDGYVIVNKTPGHFVLESEPISTTPKYTFNPVTEMYEQV